MSAILETMLLAQSTGGRTQILDTYREQPTFIVKPHGVRSFWLDLWQARVIGLRNWFRGEGLQSQISATQRRTRPRSRRRHAPSDHGIGLRWWAWTIVAVFTVCVVATTSQRLSRAPSGTENYLFVDNFSSGTVHPLIPFGGSWSVGPHGLYASNLQPTGLASQFAYLPYQLSNAWLRTTVTLQRAPRAQAWRLGLVAHVMGGNNSDKWAFVMRSGQVSLLNENIGWVKSVAYHPHVGTTYHMELVANGTTIDGKIWPAGTKEPSAWTISGRFPPNQVALAHNVGLYAANVTATFHTFGILAPPPPITIQPTASAGIFGRGNLPAYQVQLQNPSVRPRWMRLNYALQGLTSPVRRYGHFRTELTAYGPRSHRLVLPALPNGVYKIAFSLANADPPRTVVTRIPSVTFAIVPSPAPALSHGFLWGLNANLNPLRGSHTGPLLNEHFALMRQQGIDLYRLQIPLPPPGHSFPWSVYNRILLDAANAHLKVLGLITGPSPGKQHPLVPLERRYRAFVKAVVDHYGPKGRLAHQSADATAITDWEIWNEPSTRQYWQATPAQYGHLLSQAVAIIHHQSPSATVLGYAYDLSKVWHADRVKPNGWAIHYYPGRLGPNNSGYPLASAIGGVRRFLSSHHRPSNIWVTETGWNTQQVSMTAQAQNLAQAGIDALAGGAKAICFFTQSYFGSGFGEQSTDLTPYPAYAAVATVDRTLAGLSPSNQRADLGPLVTSHLFTSPGKRSVVTIWSARRATLDLPAASGIVAYSALGNAVPPARGQITLPLSGWPTYVVGHGWRASMLARLVHQGALEGLPSLRVSATRPTSSRHSRSTVQRLTVTVQNLSNRSQSGYLQIIAPLGWTTPVPIEPFSRLAPGHTLRRTFSVRQIIRRSGGTSAITVDAVSNAAQIVKISVPVPK